MNSSINNYKDFFEQYFGDKERFIIESDLELVWQKDTIKAVDKKVKLRIEVYYLIENGSYSQLLDILLKHPDSPGFTRWQNANGGLFKNRFLQFSDSNVAQLQNELEELLKVGWEENVHKQHKTHFRSQIQIITSFIRQTFTWQKPSSSFLQRILPPFLLKILPSFSAECRKISAHRFIKNN